MENLSELPIIPEEKLHESFLWRACNRHFPFLTTEEDPLGFSWKRRSPSTLCYYLTDEVGLERYGIDIDVWWPKDKYGGTSLHDAARKGRVGDMEAILNAHPKAVKEVTAAGETCLHTAVLHDKGEAVQYLLKWLAENRQYSYLINAQDYDGNTALHLATSRKQIQNLKALLTYHASIDKVVDLNARNSSGTTALDILYVLPHSEKIDMEIDQILREAGALRAKNLANLNHHTNCYAASKWPNTSLRSSKLVPLIKRRIADHVLLLTATLLALITYQVSLVVRGGAFKEGYLYNYHDIDGGTLQLKKQDSIISHMFIWFNSTGFVASVAVIIYLLNEFPLKPWLPISVSALFGSYMCSLMATSPHEAWVMLLLGIPILLLAGAGKMYGLKKEKHGVCSCSSNGDG